MATASLHERDVALTPMQPVEEVVQLAAAPRELRVCIGGDKLQYVAGDGDVLSRPREAPADFDWQSAQGLYLGARKACASVLMCKRPTAFRACLTKDPNYLPALVEMASLANRRGDAAAARDFARQALSIDTYDPAANYQFGTASAALAHNADAKEAFSITALSMGWRSAAFTALAKVYLRERRYDRALDFAESSLDTNRRNLDALQLQAVIHRLRGDRDGAEAALTALLALDPLNHCARFEKYLHGQASREDFIGLIRNELPHETYLELAVMVSRTGAGRRCRQGARPRPADPRGSLLAGVLAPRRPASGSGRGRVAGVCVPVPVGVDPGIRVGLQPEPGLAAPVLPGLDPLVSGRTGEGTRAAGRLRR